MDYFKIERDHHTRLIFPRGKADSIFEFYSFLCSNLFGCETDWLFYFSDSEFELPFCCLEYQKRLYTIAREYDLLSIPSYPFEKQRELELYTDAFDVGYSSLERKVRSNPEYYQKVVFSEIINFPFGQSLLP